MRKKLQKGAITAIFLAVVALVLTLIMAATQSQLLLSMRRSQSAADILIATYTAESEVNDIMARLMGGYLADADIPRTTKKVGDITLTVEGEDQGKTQIVTVTASRGYATAKVQGIRRVLSIKKVDEVEIVLVLDCTTSMDNPSGIPNKTRFNALEDAAVNFVSSVKDWPDADKYKIGIAIFGRTSAWLQYNGVDVLPGSLTFPQLIDAITIGFGDTWATSQCKGRVLDGTNVGLAFRHGNDYLASTKREKVKQVEIVITDGEPNASLQDNRCAGSITCSRCDDAAKNYLRCMAADKLTFVPEISQNGVRDPDIDAYAVTIFDKPPADVVEIFKNYATKDGYFNAPRASELTKILKEILAKIVEDRSTVTVKRVIPTPE